MARLEFRASISLRLRKWMLEKKACDDLIMFESFFLSHPVCAWNCNTTIKVSVFIVKNVVRFLLYKVYEAMLCIVSHSNHEHWLLEFQMLSRELIIANRKSFPIGVQCVKCRYDGRTNFYRNKNSPECYCIRCDGKQCKISRKTKTKITIVNGFEHKSYGWWWNAHFPWTFSPNAQFIF